MWVNYTIFFLHKLCWTDADQALVAELLKARNKVVEGGRREQVVCPRPVLGHQQAKVGHLPNPSYHKLLQRTPTNEMRGVVAEGRVGEVGKDLL
jgi:hypothetical protein